MLELISIKKSKEPGKKYTASFMKDGRPLTTHFGAAGMTDFTLSKDPERRRNYLERHRSRENWNDPTSAGSLSRYILWGDSTSIQENIRSFKKRFNL
jgi:hypothetical protein